MKLTQEQLTEIEKFAALGCTIDEVCIILGVPKMEWKIMMIDESSPAFLAYHKGILLSVCQVREAVLNSAISGSGPAQMLMKKQFTIAMNELKSLKGTE